MSEATSGLRVDPVMQTPHAEVQANVDRVFGTAALPPNVQRLKQTLAKYDQLLTRCKSPEDRREIEAERAGHALVLVKWTIENLAPNDGTASRDQVNGLIALLHHAESRRTRSEWTHGDGEDGECIVTEVGLRPGRDGVWVTFCFKGEGAWEHVEVGQWVREYTFSRMLLTLTAEQLNAIDEWRRRRMLAWPAHDDGCNGGEV